MFIFIGYSEYPNIFFKFNQCTVIHDIKLFANEIKPAIHEMFWVHTQKGRNLGQKICRQNISHFSPNSFHRK